RSSIFRPILSVPATAATVLSTLSLHDALPICHQCLAAHGDAAAGGRLVAEARQRVVVAAQAQGEPAAVLRMKGLDDALTGFGDEDRKSTRLNSSHVEISYAVFCLKKKKSPRQK